MDILDVNDFTNQLQKSVKDNLTPEITKVNDLTKEFKNSVIEGNWSVAIDLVGSDKVKEINTELTSSSAYFEKIKSETAIINDKLKSANGASELRNVISDKQLDLTQRIANVSDAVVKSNEQTIPSLQAQIQQEQTKLSLLNLNDSNYASQLETVNQLEETLVQENARTADLIGQQQALTNLKDVELQKLTEIVDGGGQMSAIYTKLGQYNADLIKSSEQNLEVNKDLRDVMSEMGDNKKDLIKGAQDVIDEYTNGIDKVGKSIEGAFASLPIVGGMLSAMIKGPLEEASKVAQHKLRDALINSGDATKALTEGVGAFGAGIANIGKSMLSLLVNPIFLVVAAFGIFVALLKTAYTELGKIQNAGEEFRKSLGASAHSTLRIRDIIKDTRNDYILFGVELEDAKEAAMELGDVFSSHNFIQKDTVTEVALLNKAFGIAASTSAKAIDTMMKMGAKTASDASKNIMHMQKLANKYGVSFAKIMDDVANASEEAMLFSNGSAKNLAKAAVEARKMGTSLDEMAGAADRLLDFESSINAQMTASTMMGRNINLNRLRGLALEGDAEGMAKEQLKILKQQGGIRNLNRWQQKSLAEAMGVELSTLYNLEKNERQRVETMKNLQILADQGNKDAAKRLALMKGEIKETKKSALEQLKDEIRKNKELENQKRIQDRINKAMLDLKMALAPVVESLMPTFVSMTKLLVPAFQVISFLAKVLVTPFTLIAGIVEWIHSLFTDSSDELGGMNDKVSILSDLFKDTESTIITIASTLAGAFLLFKPLKSFLGGLAGMAKNVVNFFNPFSKTAEKVADKAKDIASSASDKAADASSKLSKSGKGNQGPGLIERFNKLNTKKLIQAAGAMVILAGALWVTAKAFQEFAKVDWKNAWPGFLALGALVLAAKALEKGSMSMIKGAAAIALLGVALIPAAFAFQMFGDVSWKDVIFGGLALGVLAAAAFGLSLIAVPVAIGAGVLALLGASLIPLAFALNLTAPALQEFGKIFLGFASIMVGALKLVIDGLVSFAKIVGGVIIGVVESLSKIITAMGDAIIGAITAIGGAISGIITSIANGIATVIGSVSGAITAMVDDITRLSEIDAVNLIAVAGGIGAVGAALAGFGVGAGVGKVAEGAGNALGAMGNAVAGVFGADTEELNKSPLQKILDFAKESESIILVADKVDFLLNSFDRLAGMSTTLETAASALTTFGAALSSLGAGQASVGIGNAVGAAGNAIAGLFGADVPQDPIDQLMGFVDKLSSVDLNVEALQLLSSLNLGGFLSNVTEDFGDKASMASDGLTDIFESFDKLKPASVSMMDKASVGIGRLLGGMTRSLPKLNVSDARKLGGIADALEDFFDSIDEINASKLKELPLVGDGIGSLTTGFVGLDSVPSNIADVLENVGDGLDYFFSGIEDVESQTVKLLPQIQVGLQPFIASVSTLPLSSISEDISSILNNTGDGIFQFFDELAPIDLTALPFLVDIQAGMLPFISALSATQIPTDDLSSILNNIGDGIFQFFDELAPIDLTALPHLANIQASMTPFLTAFSQIKLPKDMDSILKDLGNGIEEFADYVNDGEADKIKEFFKDAGSSFPKFVESMGKLASVSGVSIVGELKQLTEISNSINTENVSKLQTFTSGVVDALNAFAGIQDPAVEALSAITSELYMLCDVVDKLDVNKLGGLQNINLGGVQTPIKIPPRALPPSDPFLEGNVTEGTLPPKLMMTESPSLAEAFAVESKPKVIEETMTKRQQEREVHFRRQYETSEEITKRIEGDLKFIEDQKAKHAGNEQALSSMQGGIKLVMEDIEVLRKIQAELKPEQSLVDVTTPTVTETQESSLSNFFTSPPPTEPTIETQESSLSNFFTSPPPTTPTEQPKVETITQILPEKKEESIKETLNKIAQPVVSLFGNLYNKYAPQSVKEKVSSFVGEKYFGVTDDMDYEEFSKVNTDGVNRIGAIEDIHRIGGSDKLSITEKDETITETFKSHVNSMQVVQTRSVLDQIMAGLFNQNAVTKTFTEGTVVAEDTNLTTYSNSVGDNKTEISETFTQELVSVPESLQQMVTERYAKLDDAILNGYTFNNELMNEALESRRQQLTDEGRLVTKQVEVMDSTSTLPTIPTFETPTEQFIEVVQPTQPTITSQIKPDYDIVDSTSTMPLMQPLQLPTTEQPQFTIDTVEPINDQIQQIESQTTNTVFAKTEDFAKNILPDEGLVGTNQDSGESFGTNIELSGLDTISVKGHNIFVEEIAKIVDSKSGTTTEADKKENNTQVVKKLDELILLMRKGGIAVNMDGRKVSRAVASVNDQ